MSFHSSTHLTIPSNTEVLIKLFSSHHGTGLLPLNLHTVSDQKLDGGKGLGMRLQGPMIGKIVHLRAASKARYIHVGLPTSCLSMVALCVDFLACDKASSFSLSLERSLDSCVNRYKDNL